MDPSEATREESWPPQPHITLAAQCTLGCLPIFITRHPGLFSQGLLLSPPARRRDTAPRTLAN